MRTPIKEIEIEGDDEAYTIMQVAQRLPPQYSPQMLLQGGQMRWCYHTRGILSINKKGVLAWSRSIYIGTRLRME